MRLLIAVLFAALVVSCAAAQEAQTGLPVSTLVIETARGATVSFSVELADDDQSRATGMMFRTRAPRGTGMLFDFKQPEHVAFWMKNTPIPLDMIFIRADGTIWRIAPDAVPHSLQSVPSLGPVQAVLEIAGGEAAALGIAEGDRVRHPIFGTP